MKSLRGVIVLACLCFSAFAQTSLFDAMKWRCIGPFRGGRTVGAVGIPSQPNVFFIGVNNGGVWKTTDAGRTWQPIFDDQPTGSIGDVALCEAQPNVIYVGSGEGLPMRPDLSVGDGIYKSVDGGKTWRNTGLRDGQQIGGLAVDRKDPNRAFAAVAGHPFGASKERGVYRTLDGGVTWQQVLFKDENTGAMQVAIDPMNPQVVYADLYEGRSGPWENSSWQGPGSGLYKSTDGGNTWRQLTKGLPTFAEGLGRIGFDIARGNSNILYATVDANNATGGIYRSDDAGESWRKLSGDGRLWGRGSDFAEIKVHPKNPETVFIANIASYKSWTAFKGAPGGDDYHRIWINPDVPDTMIFAADQGAVVTVNGGATWSSWYNQPTAQMYHVITDNRWPYWVYSGQQESGSAAVASRGDYGAITWRDWRTVGVDEYGYVAPDPLNPDITYGGRISRYDWRTGQTQNIAPEPVRSGKYRVLRTMPSIFSPVDKKTLYFATNVLWKTTSGGNSWEIISPDLSREKYDIPESIGKYRKPEMATMARRGVIYAVAPSHKSVNTIWAGTDDGLIHRTTDGGKTWANITPPELKSWMKVSQLDAGHSDDNTVYAAINAFRLDDLKPHIYRTRDGGKTWQHITKGIPNNNVINVVREDPQRKGLLFAGSENGVFVSFDDGDNWQSLRNNMPATSIRDLVVKDDDLVVGTHGRSFWILDDITPLRQWMTQMAGTKPYLFAPQLATRVRRSNNTDTPIPPEEPMGQNPPDGAIINYWLKDDAQSVELTVLDETGLFVRRYSSGDPLDQLDESRLAYPTYWFRAPRSLSTKAGLQRWTWDLRFAPPAGVGRAYGMQALLRDTPPGPFGPLAMPGNYTVVFVVNGNQVMRQPLKLRMDPRVTTALPDLAQQHAKSQQCLDGIRTIRGLQAQVKQAREELKSLADRTKADALDKQLAAFEGRSDGEDFFGGANREPGLSGIATGFYAVMNIIDAADVTPTSQALAAVDELQTRLNQALAQWRQLQSQAAQLKGK
jgi:photosystem II stability/assembly factor-like uncharacterized protein